MRSGAPSSDPSPSESSVLEYAPDPRRRKNRGRIIRAFLTLVVIAGISSVAWKWRGISLRAEEIYWFNRCMNHVTPAGTVLLEADRDRAKALVDGNPDYLIGPQAISFGSRGAPPVAQYVPADLRELMRFTTLIGASNSAVYIGPIRTPSGKQRLLIVRSAFASTSVQALLCDLLEAPTGLHGIQSVPPGSSGKPLQLTPRIRGKLYPGVLDPRNPSHITIAYEYTGPRQDVAVPTVTTGLIDLYLHDDDTIKMK